MWYICTVPMLNIGTRTFYMRQVKRMRNGVCISRSKATGCASYRSYLRNDRFKRYATCFCSSEFSYIIDQEDTCIMAAAGYCSSRIQTWCARERKTGGTGSPEHNKGRRKQGRGRRSNFLSSVVRWRMYTSTANAALPKKSLHEKDSHQRSPGLRARSTSVCGPARPNTPRSERQTLALQITQFSTAGGAGGQDDGNRRSQTDDRNTKNTHLLIEKQKVHVCRYCMVAARTGENR